MAEARGEWRVWKDRRWWRWECRVVPGDEPPSPFIISRFKESGWALTRRRARADGADVGAAEPSPAVPQAPSGSR